MNTPEPKPSQFRASLALFLGAFVQVTAVAANTRVIAAGDFAAAFLTGGLVSLIWVGNTKRASHATGWMQTWAYTLGAALGTVVGMWLAGFWT